MDDTYLIHTKFVFNIIFDQLILRFTSALNTNLTHLPHIEL